MSKYLAIMLLPILLVGCVRKSEYEKSQSELAAAQEKIKALESELAELRPLAAKARQLPISTRLEKYGIREKAFGEVSAGYSLLITNESKSPLRLAIIVTANGQHKTFQQLIDGGEAHFIRGLPQTTP